MAHDKDKKEGPVKKVTEALTSKDEPICKQDRRHTGPGKPWFHYRRVNGRLEPDPKAYPDKNSCIRDNS